MTTQRRWAGQADSETAPLNKSQAVAHVSPFAQRVVLLVLDGLRADLVGHVRFPHLQLLQEDSAYTLDATTVLPSVTAAAMTSLLSGVAPCDHGIESDRFAVPKHLRRLRPLSREVALAGLQTAGIVRQVPWPLRPLARRIVRELGIASAHFAHANVRSLLQAAMPALRTQQNGLIIMHWPDCDAIGHTHGWMSPEYLNAVQRMDNALGAVRAVLNERRDDTLLIALADHGGGGRVHNHHDNPHALDSTIPIFLSGTGVFNQTLPHTHTLLDVPATALWALGLPVPATWAGEPISQAFRAPEQSELEHSDPPTREAMINSRTNASLPHNTSAVA